ncbi:MAG: hypothetical protein ACMUJM_10325 [bacterium]
MQNKSKSDYRKKENYISATNQLIKLIRDDEPFPKEADDGTTSIIDVGIIEDAQVYDNRDLLPILYQGKLHKGDSLLYLGIGIVALIIITIISTWIFSKRLKSIQEKKDVVAQKVAQQTRYLETIPPLEEKKALLANINKTYALCAKFHNGIMILILKELSQILPSTIIPQKISMKRSTSLFNLEGIFLKDKSSKFHDINDVAQLIEESSLFNKARIVYQYPRVNAHYNTAQSGIALNNEAIDFCLEFIYSASKNEP